MSEPIKGNKAVQVLAAQVVADCQRIIDGMAKIAFESHPEVSQQDYVFDVSTATFLPRDPA